MHITHAIVDERTPQLRRERRSSRLRSRLAIALTATAVGTAVAAAPPSRRHHRPMRAATTRSKP